MTPKVVIFADSSEDSRKALGLLADAGIEYTVIPKESDDPMPRLVSSDRLYTYETLEEIQGYVTSVMEERGGNGHLPLGKSTPTTTAAHT